MATDNPKLTKSAKKILFAILFQAKLERKNPHCFYKFVAWFLVFLSTFFIGK